MRESSATYFEQIPVEEVTRMTTNVSSPPPADLQELGRRIEEETDSKKMIELVQQLIAKFDETHLQRCQVRVHGDRSRHSF